MKVVDEITFCGQPVAAEELTLIIECVARYRALSREELAGTLCEWLEWRRPNGRLKTRECRDLLHDLQARSMIDLPALRAGRPRGAVTAIPYTPQGEAEEPLTCALSEVQPITLRRVVQPAQQQRWRELVGRYHYLGYAMAYGASVRYWIETTGDQPTTLGCLQFSSAAWRMKARDSWIGWDNATRQQQLPRLINNSRFLILPWVRIQNLASHVLGLALRTVTNDWEALYGVRPWLAETLVDSALYTGHCYRAANWIDVGVTTGRGRQDRAHQRHGASPKRIMLYPLCANARCRLQATRAIDKRKNIARIVTP